MEGGPGPVDHAVDEVMLEGIDVDVIDTPFQVVLVSTSVLKKPSLPDCSFLLLLPARPHEGFLAAPFRPGSREVGLDQTPSS